MAAPDIDERLLAYLAKREQQRARQINETYSALTRRERRLVREAAVMGYVRGYMAAGGRGQIPDGRDILAEVIDACHVFPDLYPVITHVTRTRTSTGSPS